MSRREFQFSEGTSNKFWAIELNGKAHSVHFGRVGTAGQAQTKEFGSEDEAKKSYEKLIAEKVKKGYAEVTTGTKSNGTPTAKLKKAGEPGDEKAAPKPAKSNDAKVTTESPTKTPIPANVNVIRSIDLNPEDWHWARKPARTATPKETPAPFDLEQCLDRLGKVAVTRWGWEWEWESAKMSPTMSREEAQFWFTAMTTLQHKDIAGAPSSNRFRELPKKLAEQLQKFKPKPTFTLKEVKAGLERTPQTLSKWAMAPLANLFSLSELLDLIQKKFSASKGASYGGDWDEGIRGMLVQGFCDFVLPRLSEKEVKELQSAVRPALDPANAPTDYYQPFPPEFYMAVPLGMRKELAAVIQSWADDRYAKDEWNDHYHRPQILIFGMGDPALVESAFRRLKLKLRSPEHIRAFLAITEYAALDIVRDSILAREKKEESEELLRTFCLVKAPEAAPHMLELKLSAKAPAPARQWLDEQVGNAIAGLISTAAGRGKLADAAIDYLREAKKKGHEEIVRECLKGAAADVADRVRKEVIEHTEKEYTSFNDKTTPAWLREALKQAKPSKLPDWAAPTSFPPILVGDMRLNDEQVTAVLGALSGSTFDKVDPLVTAVKKNSDAAALDAFAWKLFQLWQGEGSPSKEKWAMGAIGQIGGDAAALKITPLIRNWPGESQHQRAVFGLDCLRAIGSDTALMQLNGIAQKLKFKGLKQKANEAMDAIAKDKGLTKSQLEDRIIPDCDLDERGNRIFDFGSRQFRFVLGPDMKPMLKDSDGKVKTDLPKPGAKDDATKAAEAVDAWKLMKKQIKEVATIQAQRLEQSMVTGRRWSLADFETLLVKHPLMTNLVRLVLWGAYDKKGGLVSTFRVTEDQSYADAKDGELKLKGIDSIGIVHPLNLNDEQKSAWGEIFSDYEIVPPFPQLGRTIYRLEKDETKASELKRFAGVKLAAPTLVFGLEKFGWIRGVGLDGGCFDEHSKQFAAAELTAVVHYEGTVGFGYIDPNENLTFTNCYFVEGMREPSGYQDKEKTVKLANVDPVAISEVLTDLSALAAKAK